MKLVFALGSLAACVFSQELSVAETKAEVETVTEAIYDYLYEDETTVEPTTAEAATIEQFSESNSESDSESEIKNSPPVSMGRAAIIATSKKVANECHYDIFGNKVCAQKTVTTGHCPLHEEFRLGSLPEPTCDMRYPFSNQKRMECFCKFGYLRDNTKGNDGPCTLQSACPRPFIRGSQPVYSPPKNSVPGFTSVFQPVNNPVYTPVNTPVSKPVYNTPINNQVYNPFHYNTGKLFNGGGFNSQPAAAPSAWSTQNSWSQQSSWSGWTQPTRVIQQRPSIQWWMGRRRR